MAQADQKCKEEIQKAKKEMEERMLKAQRASHDLQVCLYTYMGKYWKDKIMADELASLTNYGIENIKVFEGT